VEPTARQFESLEQEIPLRAVTPEGTVSCDQLAPPSAELMMAGPLDVVPRATQVNASGHVIAARPAMSPGMTSGDHEDPPFVVPMMLGDWEVDELIAWHMVVLGQATPTSVPVPDGAGSTVQLAPPFVVPMMAPAPKSPYPTAVQFETLGHEIPFSPSTPSGTGSDVQLCPLFEEL
jgi:hypothetical protein